MTLRLALPALLVGVVSCGGSAPPTTPSPSPSPEALPVAPATPTGFAISSEQQRILEFLIDDDVKALESGDTDTLVARSGLVVTTTPAELVKKFRENELAADAEFGGKKVVVVGKIRSVKKDVMGSPFIALQGPGVLDDVIARVPEQSQALLLTLKAGAKIGLLCAVRGERVTLVVLTDCKLPEQFRLEITQAVLAKVRDVATLKVPAKDDPQSTLSLAMSYAEVLSRKDDPSCVSKSKASPLCMTTPEAQTKYFPRALKALSDSGLDIKSALPAFKSFE